METATLPRTFEAITRIAGPPAAPKRTDMEETLMDLASSMRLNPITVCTTLFLPRKGESDLT